MDRDWLEAVILEQLQSNGPSFRFSGEVENWVARGGGEGARRSSPQEGGGCLGKGLS